MNSPRFFTHCRTAAFALAPQHPVSGGANLGAKAKLPRNRPPLRSAKGRPYCHSVTRRFAQLSRSRKIKKLFDSGGLYLLVHPNGSRYWKMKYRFGGREGKLSFGVYPDVKRKEARERRDDAKRSMRDGIDPAVQKKVAMMAHANSFKAVALEWLQTLSKPPQSPKSKRTSKAALSASTIEKKLGWHERPKEVYIDGARYVPAVEAAPSIDLIARGLLRRFWGLDLPEDKLRELLAREGRDAVRVYVNDDERGAPLQDVLGDIAEATRAAGQESDAR